MLVAGQEISLEALFIMECLKHPGSEQTASIKSRLTAMVKTFIGVCKEKNGKIPRGKLSATK